MVPSFNIDHCCPFITPRDVIKIFNKNEYTDPPEKIYQNTQEYLHFILNTKRTVQILLLRHENIPKAIESLRIALSANNMESFFIQFSENFILLWGILRGEFLRDRVQVPQPSFEYNKAPTRCAMSEDKDGDFILSFEKYNILLTWSDVAGFGHKTTKLKDFAKRVQEAIAYEDITFITELLGHLGKAVETDFSILTQLHNMIKEELNSFSRITITGIISNSGRSPIAISGNANITIYSKDYEYSINSQNKKIDSNTKLDLHFIDISTATPLNSLQIQAGGVCSFVLMSNKCICQMNNPQDIKSLYGSEREYILELKRLDKDIYLQSNRNRFIATEHAKFLT